jgi:hypothetical protein
LNLKCKIYEEIKKTEKKKKEERNKNIKRTSGNLGPEQKKSPRPRKTFARNGIP